MRLRSIDPCPEADTWTKQKQQQQQTVVVNSMQTTMVSKSRAPSKTLKSYENCCVPPCFSISKKKKEKRQKCVHISIAGWKNIGMARPNHDSTGWRVIGQSMKWFLGVNCGNSQWNANFFIFIFPLDLIMYHQQAFFLTLLCALTPTPTPPILFLNSEPAIYVND